MNPLHTPKKIDRIEIEFIDHRYQRYATCGDWYYEDREHEHELPETVLVLRISMSGDRRTDQAVALHELAEALMCNEAGITQEKVDKFDMAYEKERKKGDESEPGDDPNAPYFCQHGFATSIERIFTTATQLPWPQHEANITALFAEPSPQQSP